MVREESWFGGWEEGGWGNSGFCGVQESDRQRDMQGGIAVVVKDRNVVAPYFGIP